MFYGNGHNLRLIRQIVAPTDTSIKDLFYQNQPAFDAGQQLKRAHAVLVVAAEAALRVAVQRHKRNANADEKAAAQL